MIAWNIYNMMFAFTEQVMHIYTLKKAVVIFGQD